MTISVAVMGGLLAGLEQPAEALFRGDYSTAMKRLSYGYTGWNAWTHSWDPRGMQQGLMPLMIGVGVHKLANAFGVNRMLAKSKIPFLRV